MKIHAYRVVERSTTTLDAVLRYIESLPLVDRLWPVANIPMRLESAIPLGNIWQLDFATLRPEGPGKGSPTDPITDFDLQPDDAFGQETACYLNLATKYMSVQYNHYGPRYRRIQTYLYIFTKKYLGQQEDDEPEDGGDGFTFVPVLNSSTAEALDRMGVVKNIEVSFHVPGLLARDGHVATSLSGVLDNPIVGGAETVKLQITASRKRGRSLAVDQIRRAVADLMGLRDELHTLSLTVKEHDEAPSEPIDMLEARLAMELPLALTGRRYDRNSRMSALRYAYDTWSQEGRFRDVQI